MERRRGIQLQFGRAAHFNDMAFHPEKILADYVAIFHPELMPGYELKYFRKTGK